ncbi:MAG: TcpQ domain-containing protein [Herminiimonas sp.]|nr:TcpQ domain-containing protein [Herminiimonas sp.]
MASALLLMACIGATVAPQATAKSPRKSSSPAVEPAWTRIPAPQPAASVEECEDDDAFPVLPGRLTLDTRLSPMATLPRIDDTRTHPVVKAQDNLPKPAAPVPAIPTIVIAAAAPMPALALSPALATPSSSWEIALTDKTLNAALARWTAAAGWQLLWELPVDYAVEARTVVPGSFEDAVEMVTRSMETAEIPMKAIFYKGNRVLRIVPIGVK